MISVVIAAFNCAGWIEDVIGDVLSQTYTNLELIVVDDGSTDETGRVVQAIRDPRLKYVRQDGSGSPAKPRNTGLRMARGEWISFLDHDDRWTRDRILKVMDCFQKDPSLDAVCHDQWEVRAHYRLRRNRYGPASRNLYLDMLLTGNRMSTSALTIRTRRVRELNGFNEDLALFTVEDFDLWLRLARAGCRFEFLHEALGDYTKHDSNMTANREFHHDAIRALALMHIRENPQLLGPYRVRIMANCDLAQARDLHTRGSFRRALIKYREAWLGGCRPPKLWAGALLSLLRIRR